MDNDKENENDTGWDTFIDSNLKAVEEIRNYLKLDEFAYLHIHGQSWDDPSSYIIYTAIDEVQKMAQYLFRMREMLEGSTIAPNSESLQRLIYEELVEDQQLKIRRLLEILIVLILFAKTNEKEYFRHFLLVEELEELINVNRDLKEFYSHESANILDSIKNQKEWIIDVEKEIDIGKCWYLKKKAKLAQQDLGGIIMSSMRSRIKDAIPLMSSLEKLLYGFSYQGMYSVASEYLHYSPVTNKLYYGEKKVSYHFLLGLLGLSIIKRISKILNEPDIPFVKTIIESLNQTSPDELVFSHTVRNIKVGDFVLAYGDLAEVLEIKDSDYGYRSYKISYLAEKPKPEIQEDWFPAKFIQRIFDGEIMKKKLIDKLTIDGKIKLAELNGVNLQKALRNSVIAVWKLGLRDHLKKY